VLAGAGAVAPGLAAATSGGLLAKLGALPIAAKIGASAMVVGVAALPVLTRTSRGPSDVAKTTQSRTAATPRSTPPRAPVERAQAPAPVSEDTARAVPTTEETPATMRSAPAPARTAVLPATPAVAPTSAVGSFPVLDDRPIDEGTLRAENAIMERALAALKRNDFDTARRELALHAAKFPNGHLKPERERAIERALGKETK
jgi:TolA-binding protein